MSCGCKDKGKHQDHDPYADGLDAVWRDPMEYDVQKHGPPYMPVTATQRAEARQFARRQAAYYDTGPRMVPEGSPYSILAHLLAGLRTLGMVHQTAHWQTRGGHFYGDHLLFQRIYEESLEGIDGVAERLVGLANDPEQVELCSQVRIIHQLVRMASGGGPSVAPSPEMLVQRSLMGEMALIGAIGKIKQAIDEAGALTEGLDDLLQGIASKHEEFVYLLRQRATVAGYSYDRQG